MLENYYKNRIYNYAKINVIHLINNYDIHIKYREQKQNWGGEHNLILGQEIPAFRPLYSDEIFMPWKTNIKLTIVIFDNDSCM